MCGAPSCRLCVDSESVSLLMNCGAPSSQPCAQSVVSMSAGETDSDKPGTWNASLEANRAYAALEISLWAQWVPPVREVSLGARGPEVDFAWGGTRALHVGWGGNRTRRGVRRRRRGGGGAHAANDYFKGLCAHEGVELRTHEGENGTRLNWTDSLKLLQDGEGLPGEFRARQGFEGLVTPAPDLMTPVR